MRRVVNRALLLATLLLGREALLGQQQTPPQSLPDAPQPSVAAPVQAPSSANTNPGRPSDGANGQRQSSGQRGNSRPGFPPASPPAPGMMPVPPAARPNIFGVRSECRPNSSSPAETMMSCQPNIPMFNRFLDSATPLPLTAKQKFVLAARNVSDPYNLLTIGGLS